MHQYGHFSQRSRQTRKAIEAYNKVLAIKPDYVEAIINMGNVLKEQGKQDEAIASYEKALSLKPELC